MNQTSGIMVIIHPYDSICIPIFSLSDWWVICLLNVFPWASAAGQCHCVMADGLVPVDSNVLVQQTATSFEQDGEHCKDMLVDDCSLVMLLCQHYHVKLLGSRSAERSTVSIYSKQLTPFLALGRDSGWPTSTAWLLARLFQPKTFTHRMNGDESLY